MKCQDCHGVYKGILLEYRKEKEDDAQTYLIPYETLVEKDGSWIMTAKVDLKNTIYGCCIGIFDVPLKRTGKSLRFPVIPIMRNS